MKNLSFVVVFMTIFGSARALGAEKVFPLGPKEVVLCRERTEDVGHFIKVTKSIGGRSPYLVDIDGPIFSDLRASAYQQKLTDTELALTVSTFYGYGRLSLKASTTSKRLSGFLFLDGEGISLDCIRDFVKP